MLRKSTPCVRRLETNTDRVKRDVHPQRSVSVEIMSIPYRMRGNFGYRPAVRNGEYIVSFSVLTRFALSRSCRPERCRTYDKLVPFAKRFTRTRVFTRFVKSISRAKCSKQTSTTVIWRFSPYDLWPLVFADRFPGADSKPLSTLRRRPIAQFRCFDTFVYFIVCFVNSSARYFVRNVTKYYVYFRRFRYTTRRLFNDYVILYRYIGGPSPSAHVLTLFFHIRTVRLFTGSNVY